MSVAKSKPKQEFSPFLQKLQTLDGLTSLVTPILAAAILIGLYLTGPDLNRLNLRLVTFVLMWVTLTSSWNLIGGYIGYIDFGHSVFVGIGGYVAGILMARLGIIYGYESVAEQREVLWSFWQMLPVAFIVGALFAGAVGYPTLRLKGPYFSIAMLGVLLAMREIARIDPSVYALLTALGVIILVIRLIAKGSQIIAYLNKDQYAALPSVSSWVITSVIAIGVLVSYFYFLPRDTTAEIGLTHGGIGISFLAPFAKPLDIFYTMLSLAGLAFFISLWVYRVQVGKMMKAVRDDEVGADTRGINTTALKIGVFMLAGGITAMVGSTKAYWDGYIDPDTIFPPTYHIEMIMMTMLGGIGRPWGPVIGATIFYYGGTYIWATTGEAHLIITGALLITIILFMPGGILSLFDPEDRGLAWFIRVRLLREREQVFDDSEDFAFQEIPAEERPRVAQAAVEIGDIVLEGRDIVKDFGGLRAVNHVSFNIRQGEIVGLLGPNGSGKTTLFNCISGVLKTTAGEVIVGDKVVTGQKPWRINREGLSRTFQRLRVYQKQTVYDNMLLARKWKGVPPFLWLMVAPQHVRAKADDLISFLRIDHVKNNLAGNLSGGQQRLLEMGMTLMNDPLVVLLDEATSGVNPALVEDIKDDIRRLNQERGITFFLVEHNMNFAMELCSRLYVLDYGTLIAHGTPEEIQNDDSVIEAYFGRDE